MQKITVSLVLVALACLLSVGTRADEPAKEGAPLAPAGIEAAEKKALTPENAEALQKIIDAPAGVFDPEYNEDGVLLRLKIKGVSEVTRGLGAARAERIARQNAERNARATFVRFLREEVSVQENEREEVILVEKDGEEQAGFKQVSTRVIETRANGLLRGLILLDERYTGEGAARTVTVVYGWSKKLADAARTAQAEMARERNPITQPGSNNRESNIPSTGNRSRTAADLTDF